MTLASLTSVLTGQLSSHGAVAVFVVMGLDALLPVGGELTMLLAGALAAGALGANPTLLGADLGTGALPYVVLSAIGTLGYLAGSVAGWVIGRGGGRPFLARHGRWLHLGPARLQRAERWFERHGSAAVLVGRLTPLVRSFISIPAGVFEVPLRAYVALTALGSAIWCFAFAGAGWGLGANFDVVHSAFRVLDIAVVLGIVALIAAAVVRMRPAA